MIYYFTPFLEKNLGKAYNHYCELVPNEDDWITFMDGDVMQLHTNWGSLWSLILKNNKNAGLITCVTNRAAKNNKDQLSTDLYEETDILKHKKHAMKLLLKNNTLVEEMKGSFLSGFFFSFKKSTWREVGGFTDGILHVDKDFLKKVKKSKKTCLVAKGFYVLHYYRMFEGENSTKHLI